MDSYIFKFLDIIFFAVCGIFGYYNHHVPRTRKEIIDILLTGLRRLEYRGYDSAGLSVDEYPVTLQTLNVKNSKPRGGEESDGVNVGPMPLVLKAKGKIVSLDAKVQHELTVRCLDANTVFDSHAGIAHTRWATHGPPSAENAHPHASDPQGEFIVVHNGIITNFRVLRDFLKKHGEIFESETDTEVIPKLLKWVYHGMTKPVSLAQLVMDVMSELDGAYALLIKSTHYPGQLVACKRGSPLILGVRPHNNTTVARSMESIQTDGGKNHCNNQANEIFLASDASAVVEHTKRVLVLEDGDVVSLNNGNYDIFNYSDRDSHGVPALAPPRALQTLNIEVSSIMKGGFDHFMQKEIFEQPETVLQTMRGRVRLRPEHAVLVAAAAGSPVAWTQGTDQMIGTSSNLTDIENGTETENNGIATNLLSKRIKLGGLVEHLEAIRASRRILLIACGTSFHACLAARKAIERFAGVAVGLELASDFLDRSPPIFRDDTCVFVSQSGETADTLRALEYAKCHGALCVGITNTVGSAIARNTQCGIHINAGAEIGVASTKAYTSQIVVLIMMSLALSEDSVSRSVQRDEVIDGLGKLPSALRSALSLDEKIKRLAAKLKEEHSLLVFGRGFNYATALETALKVKEVALMHSEGILAGEMKHGPLALVDEHMPILVIATKDSVRTKMLSVIQQLRARHARLVVLCCDGDEEVEAAAGDDAEVLHVPSLPDCLQPVVNVVPLQLLAYHLAVLRGFDVDQPRNLAKSVTVSEEEGFVIGQKRFNKFGG